MCLNEKNYRGVNFCLRCGNKMKLFEDEEGKIRSRCTKCGWTYYKNPIPASACVILNEKDQIVVIKRKIEPQIGSWALPSGYIEINQTPAQCAIDEMEEETNLQGEIVKNLGYFSEFSPLYEKVISFGFLMKIIGGQLQAGDDAAEARFVGFDELPEIAFPSHRKFIEKVRKELE